MAPLPEGKRFAFSVFDDTDGGTVENLAPVYALLDELGLRVTKSVWPLASLPEGRVGGSSLAEPRYAEFVLGLRERGHEIGLHNVRNHHSERPLVVEGLERFEELIGEPPRVHCNHLVNRDNLYWGPERLGGRLARLAYNAGTRWRRAGQSGGHLPGSPYFWGDLCRKRVEYVRNLVFDEIDLRRVNPSMPYQEPDKRFVRFWFSSSDGATAERFCRLISPANQDRLEADGGVCIVYAHFAAGFARDGRLHPGFERLLRRLAAKDGWFVPVGALLDRLRAGRGSHALPAAERRAMERRWLLEKLRKGTT